MKPSATPEDTPSLVLADWGDLSAQLAEGSHTEGAIE